MPLKYNKLRLLIDENIPRREFLPYINKNHHAEHVKHDLKKGGLKDKPLFHLAIRKRLIILTLNKHFMKREFYFNARTGVIWLTSGRELSAREIDDRIKRFYKKIKDGNLLFGKKVQLGEKEFIIKSPSSKSFYKY
jgi:predicted nuclease of predicted toxin-antitoxin system